MSIRSLVPWRERSGSPFEGREHPLLSLRREMDTLFNDLWHGHSTGLTSGIENVFPRVNLSENPEAYRVTADLPGLGEKDVQVSFDNNLLVIAGNKVDEKEEKGREWYRRERTSGEFQRVIELPAAIDSGKATATFSKGVLTVDVPKLPQSKSTRRNIEVKPG
jgi:HSP20 family protein